MKVRCCPPRRGKDTFSKMCEAIENANLEKQNVIFFENEMAEYSDILCKLSPDCFTDEAVMYVCSKHKTTTVVKDGSNPACPECLKENKS